ncbi:MAG TPA: beta-ketoacyl-[acyl-carrier-protein] synthase family protein [Thermoanaerobaculia bacterium]|nr:beta-ketoacyl-[acyl-carrier-protein] synthase family protein [Thermoanaerobaculia bacterium]
MSARPRVVVTGAGIVSNLGTDLESFWRACLAGRSIVEELPPAWPRRSRLRSRFWSPLGNWERETPLLGRFERKQADPVSRIALLAAESALRQAGVELRLADAKRNAYRLEGVAGDRAGVFLGTGVGGIHTCLESSRFLVLDQPRKALEQAAASSNDPATVAAINAVLADLEAPHVLNPFSVAMTMPNAAAALLSVKLGLCGPSLTFTCACASGTVALGRAFRALCQGECDFALAGGAEFLSDPYGCSFRGFDALGVLANGPRPAQEVNRPFDRERSGFLFSEGGGALLVLEEREHARRRNATVLAEVRGYGETADAYSLTAMAPGGGQIRRAIELCLADAGFLPEEVDYVNAHGTGTSTNDDLECRVLSEVFSPRVRVNSTKSLLGHTLGASGAFEAVATVLTLQGGIAHPSRNLSEPIAGLAFVTEAEAIQAERAISQSFAFGGQNAVLAFARPGLAG